MTNHVVNYSMISQMVQFPVLTLDRLDLGLDHLLVDVPSLEFCGDGDMTTLVCQIILLNQASNSDCIINTKL